MFYQSEIFAKPGELIQGILPSNKRFLISNKSSRVFKNITRIELNKSKGKNLLNSKSQLALELFWSTLSNKERILDLSQLTITQNGNIPIGKGLSSSSADVLGILDALNQCFKTDYSKEKIYSLASIIEPTDPCLHTTNLLFHQDIGEIKNSLELIPFHLIYFDSDINLQIDTQVLSNEIQYSKNQTLLYEKLINDTIMATEKKDYQTFFDCINHSSLLNQSFLPKKKIEVLYDFAIKNKVGLFVAHSGTYMGLVVEPIRFEIIKEKAFEIITKYWTTTINID